ADPERSGLRQSLWRVPQAGQAQDGRTGATEEATAADSALYIVAIVRLRRHQATRDYVTRQTAEGRCARPGLSIKPKEPALPRLRAQSQRRRLQLLRVRLYEGAWLVRRAVGRGRSPGSVEAQAVRALYAVGYPEAGQGPGAIWQSTRKLGSVYCCAAIVWR